MSESPREQEQVQEPVQKRRHWFWRGIVSLYLYVWVFLALLAASAALVAMVVYDQVMQPGRPGAEIQVTIPEGATGQQVGELLTDAGLLEHESFFRLALKLDKQGGLIRHGVYRLPQGLSARQLLEEVYAGPVRHLDGDRFRLTIPEGMTIAQVAAMFDDPDAFITASADEALRRELGVEATSLEGFLMPNTYFFDAEPKEKEVVERMAHQFEKEWEGLMEEFPGAVNFDKNTVVTVASLVEEEARVGEERAAVAAVIYNRLDKGMPLQMDSTLQFALGKYGQRLLNVDKEVDSPYNTYLNKGLPPGPISNPGVASLRAALQPANVNYLYFVSNADGKTHTFSNTMAEHERAVQRYRREIRQQRRELQQ